MYARTNARCSKVFSGARDPGYKTGGTEKFFSSLSNLYRFYSLYYVREYVGACFTAFDS